MVCTTLVGTVIPMLAAVDRDKAKSALLWGVEPCA